MSNASQYLSVQNAEHNPFDAGHSPIPFYALIIGIDDYANWPPLCGAVADAEDMKQYLINVLQVSEDNIVTLYNQAATRNAIVAAFQHLRDNGRIYYGDPIVIFYAGHGGELDAPRKWCPAGKIQCLVPQDCGAARSNPPPERAPIPDRSIGALIKDIADAKGDNITLVFDCCHSSSAARKAEDEYTPRSVHLDFNIPDTLDVDTWGGRAGTVHDSLAYYGVRSHVLLAACGEKEFAYECKNSRRGQFTNALLKTLEKCSVNHLTYAELVGKIRFENQHPQCVGIHQNRVLFNTRVPDGTQVFHPVQDRKNGKYVFDAGLAHGVSHGVEFTLYDDRKRKLGVVLVDETFSIKDFETTLTKPVSLVGVSFTKLTRVGKLHVYVDNYSAAHEVLRRVDRYGPHPQQFRLVGAEEARLEVGMEYDRVVFKVLDERVKRFGLMTLPHEATPDGVSHVLSSAARYYWFLGLAKEHDAISAKNKVTVDFYLLNVDYDDFGFPLFSAVEPGFCKKDPNSDNSDVIDFVVDPEASYGIKITNNTSSDLYLNAFLFNNSDLSIVPCYTQSTAGVPEAPLKQGGIFTIGYGTGGTPPLSYSLLENQDIDVSYLKIFFATRPIDMSDIVQPSPFSGMNARAGRDDDGRERSGLLERFKAAGTAVLSTVRMSSRDMWFTVEIPVVQRRRAV